MWHCRHDRQLDSSIGLEKLESILARWRRENLDGNSIEKIVRKEDFRIEGMEKKGRAAWIFEQRNNTGAKGLNRGISFLRSTNRIPCLTFDSCIHSNRMRAAKRTRTCCRSVLSICIRFLCDIWGREIAGPFNLITTVYPWRCNGNPDAWTSDSIVCEVFVREIW